MTLPIHAILPDLVGVLDSQPNAVLIAPPGAGKTTAVAPELLDRPWASGQILLLSPRRLAARAAAERIAELVGARLGDLVGYATRMDSRQSAATRILVLTEGIFRNRIIADPELSGVSAVLFDEVHERSLDGDFGLALALEAQAAFRPDLRILAMSATLDGGRFADLLGNAPVLESAGKMHPLSLRYAGRDGSKPIEEDMARVIRRALSDEGEGDVLAFLPGVREIDLTAEKLANLPVEVLPLHGQLDPVAQRMAIRPDADGRRKVILATSIAETSLTIDGVRIVVDSGLARRARFDAAAGSTRLVTERSSQAAATQRAGRAARQRPGVAYRLWEEAATGGMMPFDPPEILEADLSALLLDCALWGESEPQRLPWLDAPPPAALSLARQKLVRLGALDRDGAITAHGRAIGKLPLPPELAHMLIVGARHGVAHRAADLAMLVTERGIGGRYDDLATRADRWRGERGKRAEAARATAARWAKMAEVIAPHDKTTEALSLAELVATAWPERVARRRDASGADWQSVGGRGFRLDTASPLASAQWLAIADVQGAAGGARIMSATQLHDSEVEALIAQHGETRHTARYDRKSDKVEVVRERRLGAITLSRTPDPKGGDTAELLLAAVRDHGLDVLPWGERSGGLRARAAFAGIEGFDDATLLARAEDWLAPYLRKVSGFAALRDEWLYEGLIGLFDWDTRQTLERLAPDDYRTPAGSTHAIDYAQPTGPTVTARVQAFFGLSTHPTVGQPAVPLVLSLTSPAGRPIQTTRDLPGFWRGSWSDVAREMRGRYPKHPWPDAPWDAAATLRTKRADAARGKP